MTVRLSLITNYLKNCMSARGFGCWPLLDWYSVALQAYTSSNSTYSSVEIVMLAQTKVQPDITRHRVG